MKLRGAWNTSAQEAKSVHQWRNQNLLHCFVASVRMLNRPGSEHKHAFSSSLLMQTLTSGGGEATIGTQPSGYSAPNKGPAQVGNLSALSLTIIHVMENPDVKQFYKWRKEPYFTRMKNLLSNTFFGLVTSSTQSIDTFIYILSFPALKKFFVPGNCCPLTPFSEAKSQSLTLNCIKSRDYECLTQALLQAIKFTLPRWIFFPNIFRTRSRFRLRRGPSPFFNSFFFSAFRTLTKACDALSHGAITFYQSPHTLDDTGADCPNIPLFQFYAELAARSLLTPSAEAPNRITKPSSCFQSRLTAGRVSPTNIWIQKASFSIFPVLGSQTKPISTTTLFVRSDLNEPKL
ncbi:hypothetical protein VP01_2790g1 [Puccinia sorghi]|uniref:Uncharacterized protein n=1 Tax=Puccinia sorghi TaxID=27349 RepID=A0A0L6V2N3_9BASI|nr:hypothetical protein VP01_2790g1 [Puccinia sorghi]